MSQDHRKKDAFGIAKRVLQERVRRDRSLAPGYLKKVFTVVARRLFDASLTPQEAYRAAGIKERASKSMFSRVTGSSLGRYINRARIDAAEYLILVTDLKLTEISSKVGYAHHRTFVDNYRRLKGKRPPAGPRKPMPPPLIDDEITLRGKLWPPE